MALSAPFPTQTISKALLITCVMIMSMTLIIELKATPIQETESTQKPYAASVRSSKVNVRSGPGREYPILWTYQHKNFPVVVLYAFKDWYKIQDLDGKTGFVHKNLISKRRYGVVVQKTVLTNAKSNIAHFESRIQHVIDAPSSGIHSVDDIALLEQGVVVKITDDSSPKTLLCLINDHEGKILRAHIWPFMYFVE